MKVLCISQGSKESLDFIIKKCGYTPLLPKVGEEYTVIDFDDPFYTILELDITRGYHHRLFIEIKSRTEEIDEILKTINPEIHESETQQC